MSLLRQTLTVSALVVGLMLSPASLGPTRAQDVSPVASPERSADCTANLGLVRSTKACVAVVHASPDAPAVDVYLNGEVAVTALAPNSATPFVELPAGDYLVQVVPTGGTVDQAVITVDPLTIEAAKAYEVVAIGAVAEITAAVFDVTSYAVPASGAGLPQSRVRVVHAVPGGPSVNVALIADDIASPAAAALPFGQAGGYLEAPAGTYRVSVSAEDGTALLDVPAFELPGDVVASVYAIANPDGSVGLLPVITAASRLPAPAATPVATPTV